MIFIQKYRNSPIISGGKIARELGLKVYTPKLRYTGRSLKVNWGLTSIPWLSDNFILNHPDSVKKSSNKLLSFNSFEGYNIINEARLINYPPFVTDKQSAIRWLNEGKVVCRTLLSGSSGRGIIIASTPEELVDAPLYVKYIKKKYELRIHIIKGELIAIQQKRRLSTEQLEARGITSRSKYIRNLNNGYIFSLNLDVSEEVQTISFNQSVHALSALSLDFGAVDVLVTSDNQIYILEVNSAPGLEGSTLEKYIDYFRG